MREKNKNEFNDIIKNIINNNNYQVINKDIHHGTNKLEHCQRVALCSYFMTKNLKLDYKAATRGALLHDFFIGEREEYGENSYLNHPITSVKNASKYFDVSNHEKDIIKTHMFHHLFIKKILRFINPHEDANLLKSRPKSAEAWIVCGADLFVSGYEWLRFKALSPVAYSTNIILLFLFFWTTTAK